MHHQVRIGANVAPDIPPALLTEATEIALRVQHVADHLKMQMRGLPAIFRPVAEIGDGLASADLLTG